MFLKKLTFVGLVEIVTSKQQEILQ